MCPGVRTYEPEIVTEEEQAAQRRKIEEKEKERLAKSPDPARAGAASEGETGRCTERNAAEDSENA